MEMINKLLVFLPSSLHVISSCFVNYFFVIILEILLLKSEKYIFY